MFLWLSLALSASQVPHESLSGDLFTNVLTQILTDRHMDTHLVLLMSPTSLSSWVFFARLDSELRHRGPQFNHCSGITFIETPNCCKLFAITLNWSVTY